MGLRMKLTRVQTGIKIETRILKVLKALAEFKNMTLGNLLEGMILHNFQGEIPFSTSTLETIAKLKEIYELDLSLSLIHI